MKKYIIILSLLVIACNSYKPFESLQEKNKATKVIKNEFSISKENFAKIKNEDSIVFLISRSLKKDIKKDLIKRRMDSFFLGNYTKKQFNLMLELDYTFPNLKRPFELNRDKNADGYKMKNMKNLKKFINDGGLEKNLDSLFGMKGKIKDSLKNKQKQ